MTIKDADLEFSTDQAVTAAAASENVVDLALAREIAAGKPLKIEVVCKVAMTDAGSDSTLAVALEADSTDSFSPDTTVTLFTFAALSAVGTKKWAYIPPDFAELRYVRLKYTPANGDLTTGTFDAAIVIDTQDVTHYAKGYTVGS